jgi:hypothetical protein
MNTTKSLFLLLGVAIVFLLFRTSAQERPASHAYEYVTIRWGGKENTHLIRPGGQVEFIGPELQKVVRPERADVRSFYMNTAMNGLSKDGWEFAGMTPDEIVMRRARGK